MADRTLVAPADMTAAVVVALYLDLYLDPCHDPVGRFSKRSLDGFSIPVCTCLSRDCWILGNFILLEPAPLVDC